MIGKRTILSVKCLKPLETQTDKKKIRDNYIAMYNRVDTKDRSTFFYAV